MVFFQESPRSGGKEIRASSFPKFLFVYPLPRELPPSPPTAGGGSENGRDASSWAPSSLISSFSVMFPCLVGSADDFELNSMHCSFLFPSPFPCHSLFPVWLLGLLQLAVSCNPRVSDWTPTTAFALI
jgi:hypothetical protein